MDSITVLLTGVGAPGAPSIIKCLKQNGERKIKIVGVDMNENASCRKVVDEFYVVPSANDDMFISSVLDVCKREKVQVVLPLVTRELMKFSKAKMMFENEGINVCVMEEYILEIVNNKANLLNKMKDLGIRTPKFYEANSVLEVETACKEIGFPNRAVCIKGAEGNGSRGVRLIDPNKSMFDLLFDEKPNSMYTSYQSVMEALKENKNVPQMLVMELLPGEEYGVDALCKDGEIISIAGRYNYSVNSSIPQGCILENRPEAFEIATEIINKLGISGNINFDFKYDKNGVIQLIEINPRLSATIASYAPAGINFPYLGIKLAMGLPIDHQQVKEGIKMQRRYSEIFFDNNGNEINW